MTTSLFCVICTSQGYLSEPTHANPVDGNLVFCCWTCRTHREWEIERRGLVTIHEWLECAKKEVAVDDWSDVTPVGGFSIDPMFGARKP